ncbi:MAG: HAD family hydrolase [Pontiellaceae bacterium]|nr:HAD family hydrolase [Pontiellaceae bacterium]MBN2786385.1 HAD family hydrolase [Pontiellaceae bacterium]
MKEYTKDDLINFLPSFNTFVGIDSDGCVFDTMEIKQKDFFHPHIIRHWRLGAIEPQVRAAAEFVYLYSTYRGLNRFLGLCKTFELLQDWPEARDNADLPDPADLRVYCDSGLPLSNSTILAEAERTGSKLLAEAYAWSMELNADIDRNMPVPPPFPGVEKALRRIQDNSDAIVISQTQAVALLKDWYRDDLARYVSVIAGPELGSKVDHFTMSAVNRYPANAILMIGDAPGDMATAQAIGCNFYPINPGREVQSWQRFMDEAYSRFLAGGFSEDYQVQLEMEFKALLPHTPPWK